MVDLYQAEIGVMGPIFYYRLSERLSVFLPSALIAALDQDGLTSDKRVFSSVTKLTFPLSTSVVCLFSPVKLRPLISGKYNAR
jgi:hypothetical protein